MPEGVQPGEGQGGDGGGLYDLSSVPEEYRSHVEPIAKEIGRNADRKFQEHAQYREQWSPYEELGLSQYDPNDIGQLLETFSDEDNFRDAVSEWAEQLGLMGGQDEGFEEDDGEESEFGEEQVWDLLNERLAPFEQERQDREESERQEAAMSHIEDQLGELMEEHNLPEGHDDLLAQLALAYADEDPENAIPQAFEQYQQIMSQASKQGLANKLSQPDAPNQGGVPNTAPEAVTDFKQAKELARAKLEGMQQ